MAHYATELFIQCTYSLALTYDELLLREGELKAAMAAALEKTGAEFLHFEEMGDTMRVQCVFNTYRESLFHTICDAFAPLMDGRVEARLLFVSKDLDSLHLYTISDNSWKEAVLEIPPAGPIGMALREKDPQPK